MNVNPFSYLIEKLKSKADKTDLANYLKIDLTTYGTITNYVHDFNDITTTGNYWCYCKYNDTQNQPAGTGTPNGVLMVTGTGDGITQLYIDRTNNRIYSRTYRASWSAWGTVALTSDIPTRTTLTQTNTDPTITKFDNTTTLYFVNGMIQGFLAIRVVTALPANNQYSVGNIGMALANSRAFEIVSADSYAVTVMVSVTGQVDIFPRGNVPANEILRATVCIPI